MRHQNQIKNKQMQKKKKNGKGKEYDIYGRLIYEGDYLKGKKNIIMVK